MRAVRNLFPPAVRNALVRVDRGATHRVQKLHGRGRDRFVRTVTWLGSQKFLIPAALAVCAALKLSGHGSASLFLGFTMLGGSGWSPLFKRGFRRGRPDLWPPLTREKSHSFPSGHATMSSVFFGALAVVAVQLLPGPLGKAAACAAAALIILTVAFSRVYLGVHWLSDVVAGILLGLTWVAVCTAGAAFFARRAPEYPRAGGSVIRGMESAGMVSRGRPTPSFARGPA
ncbi:MAG: phosphatase PAP2 family protein [Acidobacteriota bacterium]